MKISFGVLILLFLVSILGPIIYPGDPYEIHLAVKPISPNLSYLFGTDLLGRDILGRIIHGTRYSLWIGLIATILSIGIGACIGILAGYKKSVDSILNPLITLFQAFPYLLLAIAIASSLKPGILSTILALSISSWANIARLIRSEVIGLKEANFILCTKGLGASQWRILYYHILPNCYPTLCVLFFITLSTTILGESSLSFIGIGLQPPTPSWGRMIHEGSMYLRIAPWWPFIPGLLLTITILCLNQTSDFLRRRFHVSIR